jgi:cellulose synthase/poly-beta-1,6-N-acetylglucosamine synthase-like glycosyltransferase
MKVLFWCSVGVVFYTFLGYPIVLVCMASVAQFWSDIRFALGRRERRRRSTAEPYVTLVIAAHNEAAVIEDKMRNSAALDYPADKLQILVGCDGCTDQTARLARASGVPNARVIDYRDRSGKPALLNKLVPEADGEILVFSDANTMFHPGAVRSLVRRFNSSRVGAVCGELKLVSADGRTVSEGLYWKYECFIKILENRLDMLVGANGAIFGLRKSLYRPLPPGTINDDFLLAMDVRRQDRTVVYDPEAFCHEEPSSMRQEFRRRIRIGSGDLRALRQTWRMLSPARGRVALAYWSHKIFRWMVPFALPVAFVAALASAGDPIYGGFAALGALIGLAGVAGYFLEERQLRIGALSVLSHFLAMNLALLIGFLKDLTGNRAVTWTPTARRLDMKEEEEQVEAVGV